MSLARCGLRDGKECEACNELTDSEARLEEVHERHRQARVKRNFIHSPLIHQFPLEIVTSIFILTFPPQEACPSSWCSIVPLEQASPLVLTKVCHTWRALALSVPRLWSYISFNAEKPNFPLLAHKIAYSGVVPLSVYFVSGYGPEQEFAKQAMLLVIKQLHRIASLYLNFTDDFATSLSISDMDYPKTAPLLKQLHFHCLDDGPSSSFRLKLAIEPPRPRHVYLDSISLNQICIDWTNVSSLTLIHCHIQTLPPSLKKLERLELMYTSWDPPSDHTPLVSQSIQEFTQGDSDSDPADFLLTMTLPSLRELDLNIFYMQTLTPITCDFLRRSLCPLQNLSINYAHGDDNGEQVVQELIDVLEITKGLQHLTLGLLSAKAFNNFPSSGLEPLVRRFSSQNRDFLPCLETLSLDTRFIPPIDLLLDAMASNGPDKEWPLRMLNLELHVPIWHEVRPIRQDVLMQLLQMRAVGKKIFISCTRISGRLDLVEHWKSYYGFGGD